MPNTNQYKNLLNVTPEFDDSAPYLTKEFSSLIHPLNVVFEA